MRRVLALFAMAAALAVAADISGTWKVNVEIQGNTGTPTFVLKQDGEKLTGSYSGLLGDAPLTGTVKGDHVDWSFEAKAGPVTGTVHYQGTVTGSKMKGTVTFADAGEGTWEGTKN